MPVTARICFDGGLMSMPITTPYERELLWEQLRGAVRRYRRVRLNLDQRDWLVSRDDDRTAARCGGCDQPLSRLRCAIDSLIVCMRCVTDGLGL